jgi:hypothetical protein
MSRNGRISPFSEDEFTIDQNQCYRAVNRILEQETSITPGRSNSNILDIRAYQNTMLSKLSDALSSGTCEKDADFKESIRTMLNEIKTVPENMMVKDQIRLKLQGLTPTSNHKGGRRKYRRTRRKVSRSKKSRRRYRKN